MRAGRLTLLMSLLVAAVPALGADERPFRTLLVSGVFADSSVAGPFARFSSGDPAASEYQLTLLGWTVDGQWLKHLSASRAIVVSADATPLNAHFSDRIYVDGERAHELTYDAASYRVRAGLRLTPSDRSSTDVLLVGLVEQVDGLDDSSVEGFWDRPFVGVDVTHTYRAIASDRPLTASFDGFAVSVRVEAFTGSTTWSRASASQRSGAQLGNVHLRQSLLVLTGKSLNVVNRFLIGGSWDALGENALYGYRYGEFRVARGVVANVGGDYALSRDWRVGIRGSYLRSDVADVYGVALNGSKTWKTFGFNMGIGVPQGAQGRSDAVVYLAVIAPLYAK
jgi:hypothetical protein